MNPVEVLAAARRDSTLAVLEGVHALKHALRFGASVETAWTAQPEKLRSLVAELCPESARPIEELLSVVPSEQWKEMLPSRLPSPVVAIANRPDQELPESGRVVVLHEPRHLGNIGAVVRVSAAAGAGAVVVLGEADPWHPTAVRGAAGLHFALPVLSLDDLAGLSGRPVMALDAEGEPSSEVIPADAILLFGSERWGLPTELLDMADRKIAIPMRDGVSSLNLATSVAVALYSF